VMSSRSRYAAVTIAKSTGAAMKPPGGGCWCRSDNCSPLALARKYIKTSPERIYDLNMLDLATVGHIFGIQLAAA